MKKVQPTDQRLITIYHISRLWHNVTQIFPHLLNNGRSLWASATDNHNHTVAYMDDKLTYVFIGAAFLLQRPCVSSASQSVSQSGMPMNDDDDDEEMPKE